MMDDVGLEVEPNKCAFLARLRSSYMFVPSYLQVLQPTLETLHGFSQLIYSLDGVPGQVSHGVLTELLPSGALTPGLALRRLIGCRLAARQLGVQLFDGPLLAHDSLLLLQDGLSELDDRVPQLVLHGAGALDAVPCRTVPAARLCARGNGVTNEAATCSILTPHSASADQVQKSSY